MSMYGKYPKVKVDGKWVEQNGENGSPKAWPTTDCSKDTLITVQAPREQVDINSIMKKIEKGQMVDIVREEGRFEDVSEFNGLEDAIIKVQRAKEGFMLLPAEIRTKFGNKPAELIKFLEDPKNRKEAEELGIVNPKDAGAPAPIPPAAGAPAPIPPAAGGTEQKKS